MNGNEVIKVWEQEARPTYASLAKLIEEKTAEAGWATGLCMQHQKPDPVCKVCNPEIARLCAEIVSLSSQLAEADSNAANQVRLWSRETEKIRGELAEARAENLALRQREAKA